MPALKMIFVINYLFKKEARETVYWLDLLAVDNPKFAVEIGVLGREAKELNLIFNAIIKKTKENVLKH